jgi:hypothetical protein
MNLEIGNFQFETGYARNRWGLGLEIGWMPFSSRNNHWMITFNLNLILAFYFSVEHFKCEE